MPVTWGAAMEVPLRAAIAVAGQGGIDCLARGHDIHAGEAVVGKPCQTVAVVAGGHGNQRLARITGGIMRVAVDIGAGIAGGGDRQMTGVGGEREGLGQRAVILPAAPTVVGQLRAHHHCVIQCLNRVEQASRAAVIEKFQRHDLCLWGDPRDPGAVVGGCGNGAGHMGAMAVAVHRIAIVVGEIIAMHIVDIPVAVVVQTIAGDLGLIDPNVVRQIGMAVIHSGVEHSNQCAGAAAAVPSFWQVDIGIGNTTGLPGVMHPPEPLRPGVGGEIRCRDRDIGLNALKQAAQTGRATVLEARRQQGFGGRIFTTPEFEPPTGGSFDDRGLQCLAQPATAAGRCLRPSGKYTRPALLLPSSSCPSWRPGPAGAS